MKISGVAKKAFALIMALTMLTLVFAACGKNENEIVIYSSAEDYRIELLQKMLNEKFPQYDISVEYMSTGDHAAKLISEGKKTEADIIYDLEYPYLSQLEEAGILADLSEFNTPEYTKDAKVSNFYLPEVRNGGAIIINPKVLEAKGLSAPASYADLLKPEYKGLISMPNPKSSGTGYMFLRALTNAWGEAEAFEYFDALSENILAYTSSGSGPVNALIQEEVAIGLGMTAQAVTAINDGTDLDIVFFEEGSPYSMYGTAIVSGKDERECVKEVFDYMINVVGYEQCAQYYPEQIFANKTFEVENYPSNITYADMSNSTSYEKTRLLDKWEH